MSWFKKSPEAPRPTEAGVEVPKTAGKREKPNYEVLAAQRNEKIAAKTGGIWEKVKSGWKSAKDFVLTIDARTAYRAGQAKDVSVAGAQYVGEKAVAAGKTGLEAGKQVGTWAKEGATDIAVTGMEAGKQVGTWAKEGGKDVYRAGKSGVEAAVGGIKAGAELATRKYSETRTSISEGFRDMKKSIMDSAEMRAYNKEAAKQAEYMHKITELQNKIGMSQDAQAQITEGFQKRLAERGVNFEELGFERSGAEAAA